MSRPGLNTRAVAVRYRDAILDVLRDRQPLTAAEIARATGIPHVSCYDALPRMAELGLAWSVDCGSFRAWFAAPALAMAMTEPERRAFERDRIDQRAKARWKPGRAASKPAANERPQIANKARGARPKGPAQPAPVTIAPRRDDPAPPTLHPNCRRIVAPTPVETAAWQRLTLAPDPRYPSLAGMGIGRYDTAADDATGRSA